MVHENPSNGIKNANSADEDAKRFEEDQRRKRSSSMMELAQGRLYDELEKAKAELKLKDEECKKLTIVQDQMGIELEDLTASLFEEANKMVQDANVKRMMAEKLCKEAKSQVEVLQAEVGALKSLVITSTPSMPNRHLHPQINAEPVPRAPFIKGHRRSTSHHNFSKDSTPQRQDLFVLQMDLILFELFKDWVTAPSLDHENSPFLKQVFKEDIHPCFDFANAQFSREVLQSVLNNTVIIEPVAERIPFPKQCQLTDTQRLCTYRLKVNEGENSRLISNLARNRVAAVCNFVTYIRYITQGLVKSDVTDMYWKVVQLRKQMCLAKLGLS
ncbi:hypothetical protein CAPTEDRAFT_126484 [Capitella teleta]|uniref:GDP/GTP exchange factor Sec2 N-terminal domain-containing protein n=1 Tax=Capitella teleta TaxID=283909 RepID=R7T4U9_CAPTE|nr:hypothetical protein CAPTEDRAFT_126484 [Capitella teleta]|eukprot:ELT88003.1 hypothetical protein CAPTEDRAFT_126484 [Capitella teleta]